jgi:hypothetical protein
MTALALENTIEAELAVCVHASHSGRRSALLLDLARRMTP